MNEGEYRALVAAYAALGYAAIYGKGGVWLRGHGFRRLRQARREIANGALEVAR